MKLNEVTSAALDEKTSKKMAKIVKAVKKEMNRFGKNTVTVVPYSYLSGEIVVSFERWMREETIEDAYTEFKSCIQSADADGHIAKIVDGDAGEGAKFVESMLQGLRPGMSLKAEAFFPTLAYTILWKNVVSSKG